MKNKFFKSLRYIFIGIVSFNSINSEAVEINHQKVKDYFSKHIRGIGYSCPYIEFYEHKGNTNIGSEYLVYCEPFPKFIYQITIRPANKDGSHEVWVVPTTEKELDLNR